MVSNQILVVTTFDKLIHLSETDAKDGDSEVYGVVEVVVDDVCKYYNSPTSNKLACTDKVGTQKFVVVDKSLSLEYYNSKYNKQRIFNDEQPLVTDNQVYPGLRIRIGVICRRGRFHFWHDESKIELIPPLTIEKGVHYAETRK